MSTVTHPGDDARDRAIVDILERHGVDLVVLGGYMKELGRRRSRASADASSTSIRPFCPSSAGRGFYGVAVHEAVLASGDRVTGATIHLVDEQIDHGPVLAQRRVAVEEGDTAETLAERVLAVEHELYVETLRRIASGEIDLDAAGDAQLRKSLENGSLREFKDYGEKRGMELGAFSVSLAVNDLEASRISTRNSGSGLWGATLHKTGKSSETAVPLSVSSRGCSSRTF